MIKEHVKWNLALDSCLTPRAQAAGMTLRALLMLNQMPLSD